MQLKAEQLAHHLKSELLPVYLISGDEPFLVQEAAAQIRNRAMQSGFSERKLFDGNDEDFEHLSSGMETMSLFAERSLYEFRLDSLPKAAAGELIKAWCEQPEQDDMLLISCPKLDAKNKNKAWIKAVDHLGGHITVFDIFPKDFPNWLDKRANSAGVKLTATALAILVERTEGNLLAANQEIERLAILADQGSTVDEQALKEFTADNARFGHFELIDTCLSGDGTKTVRMLHSLRQEGIHPMELTGALNMEVRRLCRIAWGQMEGKSLNDLYKTYRIWRAKQFVYNKALNRYSLKVWHQILERCLALDKCIKGQLKADDWLMLENLLLVISGQRTFSKALPKAS